MSGRDMKQNTSLQTYITLKILDNFDYISKHLEKDMLKRCNERIKSLSDIQELLRMFRDEEE